MPRKSKKLVALKQTHAQEESTVPTTLDQIWGFNESARYGTVNESEYKNKLRDMTRADLENHARGVGCLVLESSERLREALFKQFQGYISSLRKPSTPRITFKPNPAAEKILAEGK